LGGQQACYGHGMKRNLVTLVPCLEPRSLSPSQFCWACFSVTQHARSTIVYEFLFSVKISFLREGSSTLDAAVSVFIDSSDWPLRVYVCSTMSKTSQVSVIIVAACLSDKVTGLMAYTNWTHARVRWADSQFSLWAFKFEGVTASRLVGKQVPYLAGTLNTVHIARSRSF
jgi:hypothetical protein